jgi:hypothetical protein
MNNATSRTPCWPVRLSRIGLGVVLLGPAIVMAEMDICLPPDESSHLSFGYYQQDRNELDGGTGQIRRTDQNSELHYELNDTWSLGIGHRYVILDVAPTQLQTNGHLHTVSFPFHRQSSSGDRSFRLSIAPALSASSNVMKDPDEYSADTFQLLAAAVWSRKLSDEADLRYGLCADHRFGHYAVYPSVILDWRPRTDLQLTLGFPVTQVTYRASPRVDMSLRVTPEGNEWHVRNRDLTRQSQLVYEALQIGWALNWQARERLMLTVDVARLMRSRYDVVLADDSRVELALDAATRVGAAFAWRF